MSSAPERLYTDAELPATFAHAGDPARMVGSDIAIMAAGVITHGRFYHPGRGCPAQDVHTWSLWKAGELLAAQDVDVAPDYVGWIEFPLTAPLEVAAAPDYAVTVCYAAAADYGYSIRMPLTDTAEHVELGRGLYADVPCGTFPTSVVPVYAHYVDLVYQLATVAAPPTGPRDALARRLVALADPSVTIASAPIRAAAPPLIVLAPGTPYLRPSSPAPDCSEAWRIDAWCVTTREDVHALDTQDALAELVREVAEDPTWSADGMVCVFLGVERANVSTEDLAGIPGLATIVQLRIDA